VIVRAPAHLLRGAARKGEQQDTRRVDPVDDQVRDALFRASIWAVALMAPAE
jgi:hypothetical protein